VQNSGIGSCAILAEGSNGTNINGNTVKNSTYGIRLTNSNNSMLENNNVTSNECGIFIDSCDNNIIIGNMISNNTLGISIDSGNNNLIHHNSFINNDAQANATESFNIWNDNYPSGGNYWSDYAGIDVCSGPYQNETGSDGIGDTQYNIGTTGRQDRYPLINPRIPQHDVAITTLYPLKTAVGQGFLMSVVLSVQNEGDYFEAVNITLTFPTFGHTIVIAGECCLNFNVTLNTTGVTMGNYTVTACISAASGETDVGDNNFTCIMCITLPGDVSGDFKVGPYDFALLATAYGATPGKPKWNPNCDINNDNKVGPADFAQLSVHYGRHYP
jgi:parallel beta-helix repeat protein